MAVSMKAFFEGYDAGADGVSARNPYDPTTVAWDEWEDGWLTATKDAKEGAMSRKSLNDVLSNDRSVSRAAQGYKDPIDFGVWHDAQDKMGTYTPTKSGSTSYGGYKGSTHGYERCYHSHPPLQIGEFTIYGGSCSSPKVTDADVYIGFDGSMSFTARHWPWKKGTEVLFKIPDMGVPASVDEFKKLVAWTRKQLEAGLKVHCGCIGGHGRTGTFLAALVHEMTGDEDAISTVRKGYCKKAVESSAQIDWLNKHFGIKKVEAVKSYSSYGSTKGSSTKGRPKKAKGGSEVIHALNDKNSIWG